MSVRRRSAFLEFYEGAYNRLSRGAFYYAMNIGVISRCASKLRRDEY